MYFNGDPFLSRNLRRLGENCTVVHCIFQIESHVKIIDQSHGHDSCEVGKNTNTHR